MDRRFEQFIGIPEQIRQFSEQLKNLPKKVHDLFIEDLHEPEVDLAKRRTVRLLTLGSLGTVIAVGTGWAIHEQNVKEENPWKKLVKLGPDEVYLYSGTVIVNPAVNRLWTSPNDKDQHVVLKDSYGTILDTQYSPVIQSQREGADPQEDAWVGIMTSKGLFYALGELVTIEDGSFKVARKTDQPDKFIDIETGAIITPQVVK